MTETWGRTDAAGTWPHPKPVWTLAVLLVALTSSASIAVFQYQHVWTPIQRAYAPTYVRSRLMVALGFTASGRYRLLEVEGPAGTRLALDDEVQPGPAGSERESFALTDAWVSDLRRIVAASSRPGGWCLDFFAGSGTLGAVCAALGRRYVLIDSNPEAVAVMRARLAR